MIKIDIKNIESKGFELLKIQDYFDLSTAATKYDKSPNDGGVRIIPKIEIEDIENGLFYITQICKSHSLAIKSNDKSFLFETDKLYRDTSSVNCCHYKYYRIKNNQIKDELGSISDDVLFYDAPFIELFKWWDSIKYSIEFTTYFQYSKNNKLNEDVIPILSFNWGLSVSSKKTNDQWEINDSTYSSAEEIEKLIVHYSKTDPPCLPCELDHLGNTVHNFKKGNPELRTDFIKTDI